MNQTELYDPNAPEGENPVSAQYVTKKDLKWMILGAAGFIVAMIPVFIYAKDARDKTVCTQNMKGIYDAISAYASDNDDRFPALYEVGANNSPNETNGAPVTWITAIAQYKSNRTTFVCPAATDAEVAYSANPLDSKKPIPSTYGFYAAYGAVPRNQVDNVDQTFLIVESSNNGSESTYDPMPFTDASGNKLKYDGFVVGWDNSNEGPNEDTRAITRLAFRGTNKGEFPQAAAGRHNAGLNFITASGEKLTTINAAVANATWQTSKYTLANPWANPISKSKR